MSRAQRRDAGLTLVEMLATLAIIAVAAGAATLGVGVSDRQRGAEVEARRLAARISLAADRATTTLRPYAFAWDDEGYSLTDAAASPPTRTASDARRHQLTGGVALDVALADSPVIIAPEGAGEAVEIALRGAGGDWRVDFDGLRAVAAPAGADRP